MGGNYYERHKYNLERLLYNQDSLRFLGEDPNRIYMVVQEPDLLVRGGSNNIKMCDVILFYYPDRDKLEASLWEVKQSRQRRSRAIDQLENGRDFLVNIGYDPSNIYKKIVYYGGKRVDYEIV